MPKEKPRVNIGQVIRSYRGQRGLSQGDIGQTVGGAVLVAALVLVTEAAFALARYLLRPRPQLDRRDAIAEPAA